MCYLKKLNKIQKQFVPNFVLRGKAFVSICLQYVQYTIYCTVDRYCRLKFNISTCNPTVCIMYSSSLASKFFFLFAHSLYATEDRKNVTITDKTMSMFCVVFMMIKVITLKKKIMQNIELLCLSTDTARLSK